LIIVVIVIKADMKRVKRVYFLYLLFPRCFFSLSLLEKPRSPQRDAEEVHGRRDYREE
tara:strand:- start:2214 stop:2387 length:174 start_codon:yes stop_codon:yes gene_type:complete